MVPSKAVLANLSDDCLLEIFYGVCLSVYSFSLNEANTARMGIFSVMAWVI